MSYKIPREPSKYQCSKKAFVVVPIMGKDNEYSIIEGVVAQVDYSGFYQYKLIDKSRNLIQVADPSKPYINSQWFKEEAMFKKKEEAEASVKELVNQKVLKLKGEIIRLRKFKVEVK